jgi:hypothetical protein
MALKLSDPFPPSIEASELLTDLPSVFPHHCVPQEGEWKALLSALDPEDRNSLRYDDLIKWADKAKDEEEGTGKGRKGEEDSGDERGGKGKAGGSYEGKRKAGLRADEVRDEDTENVHPDCVQEKRWM